MISHAAGYRGEKVTFIAATDFPAVNALCEVSADMLRKSGMNLDYQALDWGSVTTRRNNQETPDKGGWNAHCTYTAGYDLLNPGSNPSLNAVGRGGFVGLADQSQVGIAALGLVRCDGPCGSAAHLHRDPGRIPARSALYSPWPVLSGDGVSQHRQQHPARCFLAVLGNSQDCIVQCLVIHRLLLRTTLSRGWDNYERRLPVTLE